MGSASSIENAQYDATKFQQSKAIMESGADDAEKFTKLKAIWAQEEAAKVAAAKHQESGEATHSDEHSAHAAKHDAAAHSHGVDAKHVAEHATTHDHKTAAHTEHKCHDEAHGQHAYHDKHHADKKEDHKPVTTESHEAHAHKLGDGAHKPAEHHAEHHTEHHAEHDAKHHADHHAEHHADHHAKVDSHNKDGGATQAVHDSKCNDGARPDVSDHHAEKAHVDAHAAK